MRERKYVKLRVDMHEDTKFKIIDMKPERDVIHYIWNRIVLLAGKVNLEGELYLSKSIPYTIETLAIEFNRSIDQIKLALQVFIELQMVELTEENIYKVKNFAKHQNIKVKEKEIAKQKEAEVNNGDASLNRSLEVQINDDKDKELEDITVENRVVELQEAKGVNLEISKKGSDIDDDSIKGKSNRNNSKKDTTILFDTKKSIKRNKKEKDNVIDEEIAEGEVIEDEIDCFCEGDKPLGKDESIVLGWYFG
jgi:predicted phage replisome organizer